MFHVKFNGVAYGAASRALYELGRPAYVTLIDVAPDAIRAILPATGARSQIVAAGSHATTLGPESGQGNRVTDRFGQVSGLPADDISAAALVEYNRCLVRARQIDANRSRTGPRPVIGHDSTGKPIYGPPAEVAMDPSKSAENQCSASTNGAQAAVVSQQSHRGRYLVLFASDMPVSNSDITDLVVTAGDITGATITIGRALFGVRGGQWAATFIPW